MLLSNALSIIGLLISAVDAIDRVKNPLEYQANIIARRSWRYNKVLRQATTLFDQVELSQPTQIKEKCPARWKYAVRLYDNALNATSIAITAIEEMNNYNKSREAGKKVQRAWINSKLVQIFLESPYCKYGQQWGYEDLHGIQRWSLSFPLCNGKIQTPINIEPESEEFGEIGGVVTNNGLLPHISYPNSTGVLKHLGNTVKFMPNIADGKYLYNDGQYTLIQWHIHTPSEHRVNERDYPAEIHFVHQLGNNLAVIGGFVEISAETSPFLTSMLNAVKDIEVGGHADFTPDYSATVEALKSSPTFYRYNGSLTTPPCTEGVRWLIASEPILTVTPADLKSMMEKWGFNARDTKALFHNNDHHYAEVRKGMDYYNPPLGMDFEPTADWSYEGMTGAERWTLYYPACSGNIQTPINIAPESKEFKAINGLVENKGLLPHIVYPNVGGDLKNKGYTYQFTPNASHGEIGVMYRPDGIHELLQFHIHLPSEHRVEERDYVGEIHFVHKLDSSLAVLGGFIEISNVTDPFLSSFLQAAFPLATNEHAHFTPSYDDIVMKFKESPKYFKYVGSLTTPPCTEGVKWLIAEEPIFTISPAHIKTFMEKIGLNARDTQPFKNEADYDWVSQRKGLEIFNPLVHEAHHESASHEGASHEVSYEGFEGPLFWGLTNEHCNGMIQTPINFEESDMEVIKGALHNSGSLARVIYPNTEGVLHHLGDVIKFVPNQITGKYIRPEGAFDLLQWHIHTPSEHRIEGKEFAAEVHFVHKLGNTLAVIGGFVELADYSSDFIAHLVEAVVPLEKHNHTAFHPHYDHVATELREIPMFYKYTGSLTTPPCSEGVKWLVAEEPLFKISPHDWVALLSKTGANARDTKPLRFVANENWADKRRAPEFFNPPVGAAASQDWDYNGVKGPEFWGISYPECDANLQTPINIQEKSHDFIEIDGTLENGGSLPLVHYPSGAGHIKHYGDTWKFIPDDINAGKLIRPDGSFSLIQWHLHLPSEHRIDGRDFVGELHFVHKLGDSLAVLGTFLQLAPTSSPILDQFFTAGKDLKYHQEVPWTPDYSSVVAALKTSPKFFKYTGSLTTPPCSEGVKWMVSSIAALNISYQHVKLYQEMFGFTARDTKPLKYDADLSWAEKRMAPKFFNPLSGIAKPNTTAFDYNGFEGVNYWKIDKPTCGGNIQTPINFQPHHEDSNAIGLVLDNSAHKYPVLNYPNEAKAAGKLKNMGETLKFEPNILTGAATFTRPDGLYNLIQFHFHAASEHRVDGIEYPMEFHFVHSNNGKLAVIGGFAELGATTSEFVLRILEAGKKLQKGQSVAFTPEYAELVLKLKEVPTFFKYTGSLTTPPCTEGVKWLVAEEPIFTVTASDWKEFMHLYEYSARDTQPLRFPSMYDWVSMRKSDYYSS